VTVVFLDRRDDPPNLRYHCYLAQSTDGGLTWSTNQRISTQPSDPTYAFDGPAPVAEPGARRADAAGVVPVTGSRAGLLGEYIGVVAYDGIATPVWTDIRNLNQDVYAGYGSSGMAIADAGGAPPAAGRLEARPNPAVVGQTIRWWGPGASGSTRLAPLWILDASGRRVRALPRAGAGTWDGRDESGRPLAPGVYFVRSARGGAPLGSLVLMR
jgi:hypothetical protein